MTIQQALDKIDLQRPNKVSITQKVAWLNELDGLIHREIILAHYHPCPLDHFDGYTMDTDFDTKLLAPFPYDEIYVHFLALNCDLVNQEVGKYNNDKTLFNNAYDTLSDFWTRNYMPIQKTRELRL